MRSYFPDSVVFKLIELVKVRPFIWNPKHEKYNDRFLVSTGWQEIGEELHEAEEVMRLKWRIVRDTFKKELKKYPCTSVDHYLGKWQFFKAVFFIHAENTVDHNEDTESSEQYLEDSCKDENEDSQTENRDGLCEIKLEFQDEEIVPRDFFTNPSEEYSPKDVRKRQKVQNDYDLLFLKSLVPYFRYINPMRKLVLRSRLQDILLNELSEQEECNGKVK